MLGCVVASSFCLEWNVERSFFVDAVFCAVVVQRSVICMRAVAWDNPEVRQCISESFLP